jgi:hypothetical protein
MPWQEQATADFINISRIGPRAYTSYRLPLELEDKQKGLLARANHPQNKVVMWGTAKDLRKMTCFATIYRSDWSLPTQKKKKMMNMREAKFQNTSYRLVPRRQAERTHGQSPRKMTCFATNWLVIADAEEEDEHAGSQIPEHILQT